MILLTGASGFIGKHLHQRLIEKYGFNEVVALTSKPIYNAKFLLHNDYDIENNFLIDNGFENIEIIIHAGSFIPKSAHESNLIYLVLKNF